MRNVSTTSRIAAMLRKMLDFKRMRRTRWILAIRLVWHGAALEIPLNFRWTALKILGGAAVVAPSFWLTVQAVEHPPTWEQIRPNVILTFGDATASTVSLTKDTKFQFPGNGYIEFQDTKGLQCQKFKCRFSLAVSFAPIQANTQFIIGQSFSGEASWHLLLHGERLLLQREGGAIELDAPFSPKPGQSHKIDIARDEREVSLSVDDVVAAKSVAVPFTDLARDLTIGGRAGPNLLAFAGAITDVQIERMMPVFADLGKYQSYTCEQLAGQREILIDKERQLQLRMDEASQGPGGVVVNPYKIDHDAAAEELKVLNMTESSKTCDMPANWMVWCSIVLLVLAVGALPAIYPDKRTDSCIKGSSAN